MSNTTGKAHKLEQAKRLLLTAPDGLTDQELAEAVDVDRMTAYRYRVELGATLLNRGRYTLYPSSDDVTLAQTVLQKAGRVPKDIPAAMPELPGNFNLSTDLKERNKKVYTIAVANEKGGTGKTTLSIHLGAGLALKGFQALVIDMDPQGHATIGLGAAKSPKLYDLLVRDTDWKDIIVPISPQVYSLAEEPEAGSSTTGGLYLLPGHVETRNIPATLPADVLRRRLESLQGIIDVVIIDTAPTATLLSTATYMACDTVLLPAIMEAWSLDGIKETLKRVRDATPDRNRIGLSDLGILGIVPTMFRDNSEHKDNLKDLTAKYQSLVWPELRQRIIWSIAARHRHTIFAHSTNTSDLTKASSEIWALINLMEQELPHVTA